MNENESLTVTLTLENNEELECAVLNIFEADEKEYIALLPLDENGDNTDGQIYLETEMFNSGFRPAVNAGLSVSRVGGSAQIKAMKKIAAPIRVELAQYRELASFAQFGSELDADTKEKLEQGVRIKEVLKQPQYKPMAVEYQVIILYVATKKYLLDVPVEDITRFESEFFEFLDTQYPQVPQAIKTEQVISDETEKSLVAAIEEFKKRFH